MEVRTQGTANFGVIRSALAAAHAPDAGVQRFGTPDQILIRLETRRDEAATQQTINAVRQVIEALPGAHVIRADAVGASVSAELFRNGMLALGISLLMILVYIWFRFEWQFAIGAVVTLLLDVTKAIGFLAITRIEFDLVMVAAILTVIGYSTNDKVVVYDRVRENLRKYKTMPLRELIDLSINETLSRTLATSSTVFLASLPLALVWRFVLVWVCVGDALWNCGRNIILDFYCGANPVVPRRKPSAPGCANRQNNARKGSKATATKAQPALTAAKTVLSTTTIPRHRQSRSQYTPHMLSEVVCVLRSKSARHSDFMSATDSEVMSSIWRGTRVNKVDGFSA